jgi:hypothetical protein
MIQGQVCGHGRSSGTPQANGDFDEYWNWHLQREHQRRHPASYALAA